MSYRPITDTWILARSRIKYYGAYPGGFVSRARALLGVTIDQSVLHVCSGKVREYPYDGVGPNDLTMDLDPSLGPDYVHDVRQSFEEELPIAAILADPPYTEADADHYTTGRDTLPSGPDILERAREMLRIGQRVGLLHYVWWKPLVGLKNIAVITVLVGFNNRARLYSVYERCA